jgi:tol-pal system protein YbgF
MKKSIRTCALILLLAPLLVQCVAGQKQVRGIDLRLYTIDSRVDKMERTVDALQNKTGGQAEMGLAIDQMKTRLLQLEGQFEETTNQSRKLQESDSALRQDLDLKMIDLERKIAQFNTLLSDLQGQLGRIDEQVNATLAGIQDMKTSRAREAAERAETAAAAARDARRKAESAESGKELTPDKVKKKIETESAGDRKAVPPPETRKADADPETALYDKAYSLFQQKKYKESYSAFSEYLDKHPQGKLAANARFWLGECYYNRTEYELAILEYQKVIADYPKDAKASAALFKQGLAFEALKENETARIVYNKLLEEYPRSEQAGDARVRLREIKK